MKKKVLAILLIFVFVFSSTAGVYAKGFRSSGGSRSFSKSFGSSSKSIPSVSKKSSSSRSIPGSSGSATNKTSAKGFASKSTSKKYSYMQDTYKKQVSSKNFNTYKQKLNTDQQKVYNDTLKRDYGTSSRRMGFEDAMNTRSSRVNTFGQRPIFMNINTGMFASPFSYGYAYVGPWDLWFLMRASDMFWFNHWAEISPYKSYFNQPEYDKLEKRVQELEQQGTKRDPNYLDPNVDPDLQLSQQYQEQNVDKVFYTDKYPTNSASAGSAIVIIIITSVVLILVIKKLSKPKRKKSHYSKIY
ncbi:MAG TPA: hypothetical protein VIK78_02895 [Ruminiclostridium sp.]